MLKLYISKGSSALAPHILLKDAGAAYTTVDVSIATKQQRSPAFLGLNPKGRVPVLETPDGIISENPAILEYIAETHPDAGLVPQNAYAQAKARELCAYLCATVHVAFAHETRAARWADDAVAQAAMQRKTPQNLSDCAAYLETTFGQGPWALGATYSFCDPYLFLMGRWLEKVGLNLGPYPKLAAHHHAMRARSSVQAALKAHGLDHLV